MLFENVDNNRCLILNYKLTYEPSAQVSWKYMLWILIRIASLIFMSTHNIYFYGEISKSRTSVWRGTNTLAGAIS